MRSVRESLEKQQKAFYAKSYMSQEAAQQLSMAHQYSHHRMNYSYTPQAVDSIAKEPSFERYQLKKQASEAIAYQKSQDEHARAFEDAELKSTVISCHEQQSVKGVSTRNYGNSPEPQFEMLRDEDKDSSERISQKLKHNSIKELSNNRSLLDELFEQQNKELGEY